MTALASVWVFVWVLFIGGLADFHDTYSRTAFAFGISALVPVFVVAGRLLGRRRLRKRLEASARCIDGCDPWPASDVYLEPSRALDLRHRHRSGRRGE